MTTYKEKKTLNISLQNKKYFQPINNIIKEWNDKLLNTSVEACDCILLANKIHNSLPLLNIFNAYNTAEQMLLLSRNGIRDENFNKDLDEIISASIYVDINKMMDMIKLLQNNNIVVNNYTNNQNSSPSNVTPTQSENINNVSVKTQSNNLNSTIHNDNYVHDEMAISKNEENTIHTNPTPQNSNIKESSINDNEEDLDDEYSDSVLGDFLLNS